jgi:S1-C subfamily serine protease
MLILELVLPSRRTMAAGAFALMSILPWAAAAQPTPADFTAMVREKMPAVVAITTKQRVEQQDPSDSLPDDLPFREFFRRYYGEPSSPRQLQPRRALGSGFVISPEGLSSPTTTWWMTPRRSRSSSAKGAMSLQNSSGVIPPPISPC